MALKILLLLIADERWTLADFLRKSFYDINSFILTVEKVQQLQITLNFEALI